MQPNTINDTQNPSQTHLYLTIVILNDVVVTISIYLHTTDATAIISITSYSFPYPCFKL